MGLFTSKISLLPSVWMRVISHAQEDAMGYLKGPFSSYSSKKLRKLVQILSIVREREQEIQEALSFCEHSIKVPNHLRSQVVLLSVTRLGEEELSQVRRGMIVF